MRRLPLGPGDSDEGHEGGQFPISHSVPSGHDDAGELLLATTVGAAEAVAAPAAARPLPTRAEPARAHAARVRMIFTDQSLRRPCT
jgi:hypothetical protein